MSNLTFEAVNWNKPTSDLAKVFWDQQWKQIWFPEEIAVSKDVKQWQTLNIKTHIKKYSVA